MTTTWESSFLDPLLLTGTASSDTTLVQTAINNQAGPIWFPAGNWNLNALTMKPGTTFIGAGSVAEGSSAPAGAFTQLSLNKGGSAHFITIPTSCPDVLIRDMNLNGGLFANNPGCDVVHVADNTNPDQVNLRLEHVTITQSGNYGLYVGTKRDDVKMHHSSILYSYKHGLLTKGPDGVYDACEFGSNGQDAASNNIELQAVVNRVTNCDIWSSGGNTTQTAQLGIVVMPDMTGIVISGNGIDRHPKQGIYVDSGCYSISIFNNVFHSNGQNTNDTYAHCYAVADLAGAVSFDGNTAIYDSGVTNIASYLLQGGTTGNCLAGSCNYAIVGGSTPGVATAILDI